jgi:hypothetical protein
VFAFNASIASYAGIEWASIIVSNSMPPPKAPVWPGVPWAQIHEIFDI